MAEPSAEIQYVRPDGTLTYDGLALLQDMASAVADLTAQMAAIAAVAAPAGGATVDAQARTAINAIRAAAS